MTAANDTIFACATGRTAAPVAIVRLSGPDAHAVRDRLFTPAGEGPAPGSFVLGTLRRGAEGEPLDDVLCLTWKAPRSYTGEDAVEFHLHGSPAIVRAALEACAEAGARPARPGEFTRRAYLNGKLDLTQAEAVCALVQSETDAAERIALGQLHGEVSAAVHAIRDGLVPVIAQLEAHVDFPDEGLETETRQRLGADIDKALHGIEDLLATARRGEILREGARVAIAGLPNAGKSSLFNLLVRSERAIVTPHPGTTRDVLEARIDLGGVAVTLVDTAGLRTTPEEIEALGVDRARAEFQRADLVLYVVDRTVPLEYALVEWGRLQGPTRLLLANKMDLKGAAPEELAEAFALPRGTRPLPFSATRGEGLDALEQEVLKRLGAGASPGEGAVVSSVRQRTALEAARKALLEASEGVASSLSPEFVVVDLTDAVRALDEVTGERAALDERVLDALFSTFCLGK